MDEMRNDEERAVDRSEEASPPGSGTDEAASDLAPQGSEADRGDSLESAEIDGDHQPDAQSGDGPSEEAPADDVPQDDTRNRDHQNQDPEPQEEVAGSAQDGLDPPPPAGSGPPPPTTPPPAPPRSDLIRPVHNRVVAGVSAGLAEVWNVAPWVVRIGFIVLTPFGFLGPLLYGAAWLLMRSEDEPESIAERLWRQARGGQNWVGIALIAIAVIIVVSSSGVLDAGPIIAVGLLVFGVLLYRGVIGSDGTPASSTPTAAYPPMPPDADVWETVGAPVSDPIGPGAASLAGDSPLLVETAPTQPPPPRPTRPRRPPSPLGRWTIGVAFLVVAGLAVLDIADAIDLYPRHYTAAVLGVLGAGLVVGAFWGRARWLILLGVLIIPAVVISSFVDVAIDGNWDFSTERLSPTIAQPVYEFDFGDVLLDLSDADFSAVDRVDIDMNAGQLDVVVPDDLAVTVDVDLGAGELQGVTGNQSGLAIEGSAVLPGDGAPVLITIDMGAGQVSVYQER